MPTKKMPLAKTKRAKIKAKKAPTKKPVKKSARGRGEAHMSTRVDKGDKKKFIAFCKRANLPQSELFRRFVAALPARGSGTKVVTVRVTGYSPR